MPPMDTTAPLRIAIVDDDPPMLRLLGLWARSTSFEPLLIGSGRELLRADLHGVVVVCLDLNLGDISGLDVLRHLKARDPHLPVIVITAERQLDTAVEAMRMGAFDYLTKPIEMQRFNHAVRGAIEQRPKHDRLDELEHTIATLRARAAPPPQRERPSWNNNSRMTLTGDRQSWTGDRPSWTGDRPSWTGDRPSWTPGAVVSPKLSETFMWMEIEISHVGEDIRVAARGSRSEQTAPVTLPLRFAAIEQFAADVRAMAKRGKALPPELVEMAQLLSRSILGPQIETLRARLSEASGGRLLVRFTLTKPELQAVPWEALCKHEQSLGFWASSPDILPVRSVTSSAPWAPSTVHGALGILAIAPTGDTSLSSLEFALSQRIAAGEVQWLPPLVGSAASATGIFDRLRRDPIPHVLHFIGHGGQDQGNPVLRLADSNDGDELWLPVELLAQQLEANLKGFLRLIVLEACEGARPGAFASAAEMLARAGADAVVAHLWPIRADVARVFSTQLYRALASADRWRADIAVAMNEARRAILGSFEASAQAFSPVVYLRGPDGVIFDFQDRKVIAPPAKVALRPENVARSFTPVAGTPWLLVDPNRPAESPEAPQTPKPPRRNPK